MGLPAEILDHILSFLQSDTATLKACSRSHSTISHFADRYLYANVTLQDTGRTKDFLNILRKRPYITNFVRALQIKFRFSYSTSKDFLEEISSILPKLSKIRRIGLTNGGPFTTSWPMLPEIFRLAFQDCLRLPSVTDISTNWIAFPLSILNHCKHIQHLSLQQWVDDRADPMARADNACLPTIDALTLQNCKPDSLSSVMSWIKSCHLSCLEFSDTALQDQNLDTLCQILISCSHSLTSLDFDIGRRYGSRYSSTGDIISIDSHPNETIPIPLSDLQILQQLTIRARPHGIQTSFESWSSSSPIWAITQVLKPLSSLKQLTLDFEFRFLYHRYYQAEDQIKGVLCTSLHALLVQSASTIDSIHLRLKSVPMYDSTSISSSTMVSLFAKHSDLKQFVESGKLILTPVD